MPVRIRLCSSWEKQIWNFGKSKKFTSISSLSWRKDWRSSIWNSNNYKICIINYLILISINKRKFQNVLFILTKVEQKYRESNRKKESGNHFNIAPQPRQNELELKKLADDQKHIVDKLEAELTQSRSKVAELSKTVERLLSENAYYKNKDKMNDSRASLNSKVFEELGEWQRQADI